MPFKNFLPLIALFTFSPLALANATTPAMTLLEGVMGTPVLTKANLSSMIKEYVTKVQSKNETEQSEMDLIEATHALNSTVKASLHAGLRTTP